MSRLVALLVVIGCHRSTAVPQPQAPANTVTSPKPASQCASVDQPAASSDAKDIDGDGTPDLMVRGYRDLTVYLRQGDCFKLAAKLDVNGTLAFVDVVERKEPGMRDLSIDTWLMHGDRKRTRWSWNGRTYSAGFEEEIRGPRR